MKTKEKKRVALKIAIRLTVAAAKGGAKNATSTILRESYQTALAILDEIDHGKIDHGNDQTGETREIEGKSP
jgi:phage gp36-like protein